MVESLTAHPAADLVTPAAIVVEQDRPVIGLSTWWTDAQAVAASSERRLFLVTPATSRVTYPLEVVLSEGRGRWAIREPDGGCYDGLTGQPLTWNGQTFLGSGRNPPTAPPSSAGPGTLRLDVSILHPASEHLELGGLLTATVAALTGADPAGWGVGEPVTQPWLPAEMTSFAHSRAPRPTTLVVAAGSPRRPCVGLLGIRRVSTGVLERIRLAAGSENGPDLPVLDALARVLAGRGARSIIAAWQPGRPDATREPRPTPPSMPIGVLFGHEALAPRGTAHARRAPARTVTILGPPAAPACWCRLDPGNPHQTLADVLDHFAPTGHRAR